MNRIIYFYLTIFFIISAVFFFATCELFKEENCDSKMEEVRANRGEPEEVNRYDASDYHSVDWWYWSQGICYTFTWGSLVGGCEVSTYTFTPITSAQEKAMILEQFYYRRTIR
jgi:hypothetical protein